MRHVHVLADWWFRDPALLRQVEPARAYVRECSEQSGVVLVDERWHQFEPEGFTGVILLSSSHISLHSWPTEGLLALDIFTCVEGASDKILDALRERLQPDHETTNRLERCVRRTGA